MTRPIRHGDRVECTLTGERGEVKNQYRDAAGNVTHMSVAWYDGTVSLCRVTVLVLASECKGLLWD